MFTKAQIQQKLSEKECDLDINTLKSCLKTWKIDPVYEDEKQEEYFDEISVSKLKLGLNLKGKGKSDREIVAILNNGISRSTDVPVDINTKIESTEDLETKELSNITVDVTGQTLSLLAETIAQKITSGITDKIHEVEFLKPILDAGKLQRDNEVLAAQIEKLLEENRRLASKVNNLQSEKNRFKQIVGALYMKLD